MRLLHGKRRVVEQKSGEVLGEMGWGWKPDAARLCLREERSLSGHRLMTMNSRFEMDMNLEHIRWNVDLGLHASSCTAL